MGKNQVSCNVAGCVICGDHPQEMNITYADTSLPCPSCSALRARVAVLEKVAEAVNKYIRCAHHIHTEQSASTNRTTVECATFIWDEIRAALAAKEGG